jgi:CubicO group peptidase (beta-lactamase class C family)
MKHLWPVVDRRSFLSGSAAGIASLLGADRAFGLLDEPRATGRQDPKLQSLDDLMRSFVARNNVPGAALAVTRRGKLVYARGFGFADVDRRETVKPDSLFRIASISKTITATAVLKLVEDGKVTLDTRVFRYLDLRPHFERRGMRQVDPRLRDVTVQHLLNHTGGWEHHETGGPMSRSVHIAHAFGVEPPAPPELIIRYMMGQPLDFAPGQRFEYSNFGFCVLGRVIEKASGMRYGDYVRKEVLAPLAVERTRLGRTLYQARAPGEVRYYDAKRRMSHSVMGRNGRLAPEPYGGFCIEAMDSCAGWISSAIDLLRFAATFDDPTRSKILSEKSIKRMFSRPPGDAVPNKQAKGPEKYYGCGWWVRPATKDKFSTDHFGALDGNSSILFRRFDGISWAALFNTQLDAKGEKIPPSFDPLIHEAVDKVKTWPDIDLFD